MAIVDLHLSVGGGGYVAHPNSSKNYFLNDLISAIDTRSYNAEIKLKVTHLKCPTAIRQRAFHAFL